MQEGYLADKNVSLIPKKFCCWEQLEEVQQQQQPPFYGHCTGQPALAGTSS